MEKERTKTGLVGFFDILGYQNLLERNEPEKIAEEVLPILINIGSTVTESLEGLFDILSRAAKAKYKDKAEEKIVTEFNEYIKKIMRSIRWLIFSDTLLLTIPIDEKTEKDPSPTWLIFLTATHSLQNKLFKAGLPVRGAIDYGKFFIKDTCFAGRTIVNAYRLCSQIELAACVLSEVAAKEFLQMKNSTSHSEIFDVFVIEYLVPMKSGEKHLLSVAAHTYNQDSIDIHGDVMRSFWGNKKDIPLNVRQKAQNTEQWLEFLEYRRKMNEQKEKSKAES